MFDIYFHQFQYGVDSIVESKLWQVKIHLKTQKFTTYYRL
jgi:hypothetical protein